MTKKTLIITLLATILAAPAIFAADQCTAKPVEKPVERPDFTMPKLKFENIEEACYDFINKGTSLVPEAKYIAKLALEGDSNIRLLSLGQISDNSALANTNHWYSVTRNRELFLKTSTGKKLSSKQKEFILNGHAILLPMTSPRHRNIFNMDCLGVDKEQAKNTAIAFLEYLNGSAEKKYRHQEEYLQKYEKEYQELSKETESSKKKLEAAKEKFEKQKRRTHYQNDDAALKAIERMNVICETKNIEHQVLQAKRQAVRDSLNTEGNIKTGTTPDEYNRQPIVLKLEELRVDISIALAETQATHQAAGRVRSDAELFIKYQDELSNIATADDRLGSKVRKIKNNLEDAKHKIADPDKRMLPPKIIDNKIILQPLQIPDNAGEHKDHENH
jgi:hypothetical protein